MLVGILLHRRVLIPGCLIPVASIIPFRLLALPKVLRRLVVSVFIPALVAALRVVVIAVGWVSDKRPVVTKSAKARASV